ncbi:DUF4331 family protein [Zobellia nedashkovskayae]
MAAIGAVLVAADHIDAPGTTGNTADIADFYGFESPSNPDNTVFIVDLQTDVLPDLAYGSFDENVLTEINIDTDNDLIEDLVIQAIPRGDTMYFFGPVTPDETGKTSGVMVGSPLGQVAISTDAALTTTTETGISLFPRTKTRCFLF